jgi:predicted nucleotidyltransferase
MTNGHLKAFDSESDLDIAVISARHFELAWRELLVATQPHLTEISEEVEKNLQWQRKRLLPLLKTEWVSCRHSNRCK